MTCGGCISTKGRRTIETGHGRGVQDRGSPEDTKTGVLKGQKDDVAQSLKAYVQADRE